MRPIVALLLAALALAAGEPALPDAKAVDAITYDDVTEDGALEVPFAASLDEVKEDETFKEFMAKLDSWEAGRIADVPQRVRNWVALCALSDLIHGLYEPETPLAVFERLKASVPRERLVPILATIVLHPDAGTVPTTAPSIGIDGEADESIVRERTQLYAKKMLGRLLGKLPRAPAP